MKLHAPFINGHYPIPYHIRSNSCPLHQLIRQRPHDTMIRLRDQRLNNSRAPQQFLIQMNRDPIQRFRSMMVVTIRIWIMASAHLYARDGGLDIVGGFAQEWGGLFPDAEFGPVAFFFDAFIEEEDFIVGFGTFHAVECELRKSLGIDEFGHERLWVGNETFL
ncbi:hypothetical protein DFJ77DRAFT_282552 [Powellomyces hirtus]|nr:hypothetical protein DFJ77DRAFT_282552 [Powellomyces hirtus]